MLETRSLSVRCYAVAVLVLATTASLSLGQVGSVCNDTSLRKCDLCISASPECSWCPLLAEDLDMLMANEELMDYVNLRCRGPDFPSKFACNESVAALHGSEENPQTVLNKIEDRPLSEDASDERITQVRPQNVSIKLRQGDTVSFDMDFTLLRNTPLDVYFLADVSSSLQFTIRSLRNDINAIAETLREISSGFAIGFGSFVDKQILPFAHFSNEAYTDENQTARRCLAFGTECVPTYVYHHSIPLTNDVQKFQDILANVSQLSANLDAPESALDAIVQAALCTDIIGWRKDALKMVFLVTDQTYKTAGDGKVAGLVRPNSGTCNLAKIPNNPFNEYEYTRGTDEDYVSVWQLVDALERNQIVPIFVIQFDFCPRGNCSEAQPIRSLYGGLVNTTSIPNTIQAQTFFFDSSNRETITQDLINVIQEAYNRTAQTVQVGIPTNFDGYSISVKPVRGCTRSADDPTICQVNFDEIVTFNVSITLDDCTKAEQFRHQLRGGVYDFTYIDVEPLCSCECTQNNISDESVCTMGRGDLVCGVCDCDPQYSGPECQCKERGTCLTSEDCNGYVCDVCGKCDCNGTAEGLNCQCDDTVTTCPKGVNIMSGVEEACSGSERGKCNCDEERCECKEAPLSKVTYFKTDGRASDIDTDNSNNCECDPDMCFNQEFPGGLCYNQVTGNHDNSLCTCDGCDCSEDLFLYRRTCTNSDLVCGGLETCVEDYLRNQSPDCQNHTFTQIGEDEVISGIPDGYQDVCTFQFDGCTVEFYFSVNDTNAVIIENSNTYDCDVLPIPWIIAGSLVGAIILLGIIALVIVKYLLWRYDKMEYKKFMKELKQRELFANHNNPLYITPQQDYPNPIRRTSSRRSQ